MELQCDLICTSLIAIEIEHLIHTFIGHLYFGCPVRIQTSRRLRTGSIYSLQEMRPTITDKNFEMRVTKDIKVVGTRKQTGINESPPPWVRRCRCGAPPPWSNQRFLNCNNKSTSNLRLTWMSSKFKACTLAIGERGVCAHHMPVDKRTVSRA